MSDVIQPKVMVNNLDATLRSLVRACLELRTGMHGIYAVVPTDGVILVGDGTNWVGESGATARASLGLTIGTNVQAWSTKLDAIAGLAVTDSNIIVGNGTTWVAESGATARTSLGVAIGSDVQAYSSKLADIAALAATDSNIIVGNGSTWVAESGATARTSLGLGSIATQAADSVNIDGGSIDGTTIGASAASRGSFTYLTCTGTSWPVFDVVRTTTVINSWAGAARLVYQTSNGMIDGFGPCLGFAVNDSAGVVRSIGFVGAVRQGADTEGKLTFKCGTNGGDEWLTIDKDGVAAFSGRVTTAGGFHVGGASDPGTDKLLVDSSGEFVGDVYVGSGMTVGGNTTPDASLHVVGDTGNIAGRVTQLQSLSGEALNLICPDATASPVKWWCWGVNSAPAFRIVPGTDFSGTTGLFVDVNGDLSFGGHTTWVDGKNMVFNTTTGTKIGTATTQKMAFYGSTPIAKPTVTGSKGGNAALTSLCSALASLGLITNSTT